MLAAVKKCTRNGAPPETVTEARRTLDFVIAHQEEISFLNLAIFNMPVGKPEAGKYGTAPFYEGDLSLYTVSAIRGGGIVNRCGSSSKRNSSATAR